MKKKTEARILPLLSMSQERLTAHIDTLTPSEVGELKNITKIKKRELEEKIENELNYVKTHYQNSSANLYFQVIEIQKERGRNLMQKVDQIISTLEEKFQRNKKQKKERCEQSLWKEPRA